MLRPAPPLAPFVTGYWLVEDLAGEHQGDLIRTSPIPLAVLSVNMGRPNANEAGELVPRVSLLGLQSHARAWRSFPDTSFVMAMLSIAGFIRLFPNIGPDSADNLLDLEAVIGSALASSLAIGIGREQQSRKIAAALDAWLIRRLSVVPPRSELRQIAAAHEVLRQGGTVERAAATVQIDRRQLHRLFGRHLGVGPQELAALERLQFSLNGVQAQRGSPLQGYSDQAHQIRNWKQRLGVTPGAYARAARTPMADHFRRTADGAGPAYYL